MQVSNNLFTHCGQLLSQLSNAVTKFFKNCFGQQAETAVKVEVIANRTIPKLTSNNEDAEFIIGIDLGTTNSCVAIAKCDSVEVIPDANGARTIPSTVSFKGQKCRVGAEAEGDPEHTLYSTKRFIGRKHAEVGAEIAAVPYKVTKNENGDPVFEIDGQIITPEDAAAKILTKMKQIAEERLGKKVTKAIVTVPAYFNDSQRQATRNAGLIAGLDVLRIIAEPTAAALAYGIDKTKTPQKIAVYDLGGGTFDVSILNLEDGIFEVLATNGDTRLGGDDFDNTIVRWMRDTFKQQHGIDLSQDKVALERIHNAAVKAKIALSSAATTQIDLPNLSGTSNLTIELTRQKLEELCHELIARSVEPCRKAMEDAHLSEKEINQVVLVGGMTRMPAVQNKVKEIFKREPNTSVNPDEAVALGAAIQAGALMGDIHNVLLIDVAPLTLGIEVQGGMMVPLIKRNSSIPISDSMIFSTAKDNQSSVKIKVFQGERKMTSDNQEIGQFELDGIPPAPLGTPQIEVKFHINGDGILHVTAKDVVTGKEQKVRIQAKSGLTNEEVQKRAKEAEVNKDADEARFNAAWTRNSAHQLLLKTEKESPLLKNTIPPASFEKLQTSIDALKKALKGEDTADINTKKLALEKEQRLILRALANKPK